MSNKTRIVMKKLKELGYKDIQYLCRGKMHNLYLKKSEVKKHKKEIFDEHTTLAVYTAKRRKFHIIGISYDHNSYTIYKLTRYKFNYAEKQLYNKKDNGHITVIPDGYDPKLNCWVEIGRYYYNPEDAWW